MPDSSKLPDLPSESGAVTPVTPTVEPAAHPEEPQPINRRRFWIAAAVVVAVFTCIACGVLGTVLYRSGGSGTGGGMFGGSQIAVVYLEGAISGTSGVTPEKFYKDFNAAVENPSIGAIVIRVESPGGTVAASQEMAEYVKRAEKPVVVSVGDLCASGGYMVASQADRIVAMPGSSVGSIGVIMTLPNVQEALGKLGIEMQVITSGENKDTGSMFRPLREDEVDLFRGELEDIYAQFIEMVAEGRGMTEDDVREIATGRTYLGDRALDLGLVDEIGTLQDAGQVAADLAGIEGDWSFRPYRQSPDLFSALIGSGLFSSLAPLQGIENPTPQLR